MSSTYIAYFDEFGHIGPFVSRHDTKHKTSPIFGLGGIILPANTARNFSAWFHWYKESIFSYEIQNSGIPSYNWEKKGSTLFKTHGTLKYGKNNLYILRAVVTKLRQCNGYIMYAGM